MNRSTVRRAARVQPLVTAGRARWPSMLAIATLAACMPLAGHASISYGEHSPRDACPDPQFGACYIGVDGSSVAFVDMNSSSSFSFVGLGVNSSELGAVAFPGTAPTSPVPSSGTLTVQSGASLSISGTYDPLTRPATDVSLVVGLGANSTGSLFVNGGTVNTPILVIGEYDDTRPSTGTATLANANSLTSRITATLDSGSGATSGVTAIQLGRGAGSMGTLSIGFGDTVAATNGSASIGRDGTAVVNIGNGGTFSTAGSIYASAADTSGMSTISVGGTLTVGGNLLLGIAVDTTTTGLNQGFLKPDAPGGAAHGKATLTLNGDGISGGIANGNVILGDGGTINGTGRINGSVQAYQSYVSPGHSPGTIQITGDYLMDGGTYLVQIAGTGPGQTDFLDIGGMANLSNATILFQFIDGFAPDAGFTFDFLHADGGVTASNLTFEEEGLAPGFEFRTAMDDGGFAFIARTDGTALVPEPGSLALLTIGLLGVALARRRRGLA